MFARKSLLKQFLFSASLLLLYVAGCVFLAWHRGMDWSEVPVSAFLLGPHPLLLQCVSAATIFCGIALLYFVPGIFIIQNLFPGSTDRIELVVKGFLVNYFLYYSMWLIHRIISSGPFERETMVLLFFIVVVINLMTGLCAGKTCVPNNTQNQIFTIGDKKFFVVYLAVIAVIFFIFREKIFYYGFFDENEGLRQFWTAHSVRYQILPTFYNEKYTLLAGFPWAPSIYLNMFAMTLFGDNGLSVRIEILVAFICIGLILRKLVVFLRGRDKVSLLEYMPLLLFMAIYFLIIAYRGGYDPPTELAKSIETPMMALFLAGFYLLLGKNISDIMPALLFFLASSIRPHLIPVVLFPLILLQRKRALFWFLFFWLALLSLFLIAISHDHSLLCMVSTVQRAFVENLYDQPISIGFFLSILNHYFVLTSGLSIFFIFTWRNRYGRMLLLTSVVFLLMPLKANYIPAHFFVPIIFFPLLNYYLWTGDREKGEAASICEGM